jgi:hypothetical protein
MSISVTLVEPDQVESWTRDIEFTYQGREFSGWMGWSVESSYQSWFRAADGQPVPPEFQEYDFLSDLDDLSLLARRHQRAREMAS